MILCEVKPGYEIFSMVAQGVAAVGAIWVIWKQVVNAREDNLRQQSSIHQLAELADQSITQSKRMTEIALHLARMVELYSHFSASAMEFKKQTEESEKERRNLEFKPMITISFRFGGGDKMEFLIQNNGGGRANIYKIETSTK